MRTTHYRYQNACRTSHLQCTNAARSLTRTVSCKFKESSLDIHRSGGDRSAWYQPAAPFLSGVGVHLESSNAYVSKLGRVSWKAARSRQHVVRDHSLVVQDNVISRFGSARPNHRGKISAEPMFGGSTHPSVAKYTIDRTVALTRCFEKCGWFLLFLPAPE